MPSRNQQRARFALQKVREAADGQDRDRLKANLLKFPARLHANGLGQTVAFYLSAGTNTPESRICGWMELWLKDQGGPYRGRQQALIDLITEDGPQAVSGYRAASTEARELSVWLKRFAEAFL